MDALKAMQAMEAEWQCQKLLFGFFRCLDENDYDGILARMHPEGTWLRLEVLLRGKAEILAAMKARSKTLYIHHIITNMQVSVSADQSSAESFAYLTVYRHNDGKPYDGPVPLRGPWNINRSVVEFRKVDGNWLIYRMANRLSFAEPA